MSQLINERDLGIEEMTDDFIECFKKSCEHNTVCGAERLDYLIRYLGACNALLVQRIRKLEGAVFEGEVGE